MLLSRYKVNVSINGIVVHCITDSSWCTWFMVITLGVVTSCLRHIT